MTDAHQAQMIQETHDTVIALKATLDERCSTHHEDLERLNGFVYGNGKDGAQVRIKKLEWKMAIVWTSAAGVVSLAANAIRGWLINP